MFDTLNTEISTSAQVGCASNAQTVKKAPEAREFRLRSIAAFLLHHLHMQDSPTGSDYGGRENAIIIIIAL
jgi:hypothetical protein